jgi:glutamyl/glutaminyl-tRNA synthetase
VEIKDTSKKGTLSRIAPTPSGYLHAGNAFSFVLTWLLVRSMEGKLLLRIDDSDTTRSRPAFIDDIFYTLDWLGLDYDLGPHGPDDFDSNFSQRHRTDLYKSVLAELRDKTGLVYACTCSRKQIQEQNASGLYTGSCRSKKHSFTNDKAAWRIEVPAEKEIIYTELLNKGTEKVKLGSEMADFVIRRKDGLPAYQLSSLADDMHYGVNLLVRGSDLSLSTAAQLYLAEQLSHKDTKWSKQAASFQYSLFFHHPLLSNEKGEKLSKSKGALSVARLRAAGKNPTFVYKLVADFLGLPENENFELKDLLLHFNLSELQKRYSQ